MWGAIIAAAVALTGTHTVFRLRDRARRRQVASAQAQAAMATGTPMPLGERNTRAIPQDVKVAVAARDGGRCRQCGSTQDLHYDHVIPWSKGGANTVANIQLLCARCNRAKSDR